MDQASGAVYLESWQKRGVARLADASGSTASRIWSISFMRFRMRCNLETAPNIGELSSIGPLLEGNVPVFPMARRSRGGPPDLWAIQPTLGQKQKTCKKYSTKTENKRTEINTTTTKDTQNTCIYRGANKTNHTQLEQ